MTPDALQAALTRLGEAEAALVGVRAALTAPDPVEGQEPGWPAFGEGVFG